MNIHIRIIVDNGLFSQLFGRTVKASIAIDNGRATEFIRRRNYTDKTKCYECGVSEFFCPVMNYNYKDNLLSVLSEGRNDVMCREQSQRSDVLI